MNKIKYIIIASILAISFYGYSQGFSRGLQCNVMKNGSWSKWAKADNDKIEFYEEQFLIYESIYNQYKIKVSYNCWSKKKEKGWYIYKGSIEYFTVKKNDKFYFNKWINNLPKEAYNGGESFKKETPAIIKFKNRRANEAHKGTEINVYFEGKAIGISPLKK